MRAICRIPDLTMVGLYESSPYRASEEHYTFEHGGVWWRHNDSIKSHIQFNRKQNHGTLTWLISMNRPNACGELSRKTPTSQKHFSTLATTDQTTIYSTANACSYYASRLVWACTNLCMLGMLENTHYAESFLTMPWTDQARWGSHIMLVLFQVLFSLIISWKSDQTS